ncbi:hypothetical protein BN873_300062 [Candidatus Competibacter denitrificans Run_A_D11]|uniref:Uncharacterized protein n=1 Tax=Candidatus Competibacter denitrificans Run_A_D11 TaxID=1400863 RepID=W6M3U6_9GAMM|nr:hypothetical protein BN873_300062 [Candidatus Competibacter denitrificans Run_A_D11]
MKRGRAKHGQQLGSPQPVQGDFTQQVWPELRAAANAMRVIQHGTLQNSNPLALTEVLEIADRE